MNWYSMAHPDRQPDRPSHRQTRSLAPTLAPLRQSRPWVWGLALFLGLSSGADRAQAQMLPAQPFQPSQTPRLQAQTLQDQTFPAQTFPAQTFPAQTLQAQALPVQRNSRAAAIALPQPLPEATAAARAQQAQEQDDRSAPDRYDLDRYPLTAAYEGHWRQTLWATALREPEDPAAVQALVALLSLTDDRLDPAQQRLVEMALQVSHQLYRHLPQTYAALEQPLRATVAQSPDPEWVALALSALVNGGVGADDRQALIDRVQTRFPQWSQILPLNLTLRDLAIVDLPVITPPLADLLQWQSVPGEPQVYVLCRPDRGVLCRAILKTGTGEFYREEEGLWSVLLSGRSLHDLPWQFRRGETPQGLFRMEGTVPQPDTEYFRAFGFFDLVNLYVPFEAGVKAFIPAQSGTLSGGLSAYQALLPPRWRGYGPIQQSYWAGKQGRSLFRIHGTGEDPSFFRNNRHYPASEGWNPAIGCLSAQEQYDAQGRFITGGMPTVLQALTAVGGQDFTGYVTVVEVGEDEIPGVTEAIAVSHIDQVLEGLRED